MDDFSPFVLNDLWSHKALDSLSGKAGLFEAPDFTFADLDGTTLHPAIPAYDLDLPELVGNLDGDNHGLDQLEDLADSGSTQPAPTQQEQSTDLQHDIWSLDLDEAGGREPARLLTWEGFERKSVPFTVGAAYLSEAGPDAFDTALLPKDRHDSAGVLPRGVSLRSLCNLALGRSSVFFQWDEATQSFAQTLLNVPTAGLSMATHKSYPRKIMKYAAMYRRLQAYSAFTSPLRSSSAVLTALRRSIANVTEAIEANITASLPHIRSLLQLQGLLEEPWHILQLMDMLRRRVHERMTDEAAIASLSDAITGITATGSAYTSVLEAVLAQVCRPWLTAMAADLGLVVQPFTTADLALHEHTLAASLVSVTAGSPQASSLLAPEDNALIGETRATVSMLRTYLPNALHDGTPLLDVPGSDFGKAGARLEDGVWTAHDLQQESCISMRDRMDSVPSPLRSTGHDPVCAAVITALAKEDGETQIDWGSMGQDYFTSPFDILRPAIEQQAQHLNRVLLRYLFQDCRLRHHLNLQHAFHLLGNGDFVERLTTALFSTETQTAERRRGIVPTGETMGLRLGVRDGQRWPPASSELRLTLAGVLSEAYRDITAASKSALGSRDLPGGLSFAIRELPDEEIDRVVDAGSIYALDFLRLQFAAPPPLDAVLTPASMQQYDDIFRFLLRLVRAVYLTARIRRSVCRSESHFKGSGAARFAVQAHHVTTALMSYFVNVGISAPWASFRASLDDVEAALESEPTVGASINTLRDLHLRFLETVRTRLFLKRKQQAVRLAIEDVLTAILKSAAVMQVEDARDANRSAMEESGLDAAVIKLLALLRTIVDTPPKTHGPGNLAEDDGLAMQMLLAMLDWNDFYGGQAST
ncbi:hypothetical protein LTR53_008654 [Teratosphaeriaceae sp. CCFEE 6253]|nr:hypothetical protein LTR53_008654 [Teratosphaeriaceae sp. CCFEE 6253]